MDNHFEFRSRRSNNQNISCSKLKVVVYFLKNNNFLLSVKSQKIHLNLWYQKARMQNVANDCRSSLNTKRQNKPPKHKHLPKASVFTELILLNDTSSELH